MAERPDTRSTLRDRRTWGFRFSRAQPGQPPVSVQARYLDEASIEEGPGWRLAFNRDPGSRERTTLFLVPLGDRCVAIQFAVRGIPAPPRTLP